MKQLADGGYKEVPGLASRLCRVLAGTAAILAMTWGAPQVASSHVTEAGMPDAVAETEYQILLEFQPEKTDVRNKLAMIYVRKKRFKEAEDEFRTVLKTDQANFNAMDGLGLVMNQTGRAKEAVEQLLRAIKINPQDVMVHYHLGLAYSALGDHDSALKAYRQALTLAEQPSATPTAAADLDAIRNALGEKATSTAPQPPPR